MNNRRSAAAAATPSSVSSKELTVTPTQAIRDALIKGWECGKA